MPGFEGGLQALGWQGFGKGSQGSQSNLSTKHDGAELPNCIHGLGLQVGRRRAWRWRGPPTHRQASSCWTTLFQLWTPGLEGCCLSSASQAAASWQVRPP